MFLHAETLLIAFSTEALCAKRNIRGASEVLLTHGALVCRGAITHRGVFNWRCIHRGVFFTRKCFLDIGASTQKDAVTGTVLHKGPFAHQCRLHFHTRRCFYNHGDCSHSMFLHRETLGHLHGRPFSQRHVFTRRCVHRGAFTCRHFYPDVFLFYSWVLVHRQLLLHKVYTRLILHTYVFSHRYLYNAHERF